MAQPIPGIHHVTAIAGDPQRNVDFYVGTLGLRLVKLTVNYDDPGTYHLYYGDGAGSPGTILTFFPWPHVPQGRPGAGQATAVAFAIAPGSLGYWSQRLAEGGAAVEGMSRRFDADVLTVFDPDGLRLELVAEAGGGTPAAWPLSAVPPQHAIRGFYGVTLTTRSSGSTEELLSETMGFARVGDEGSRIRYRAHGGGLGSVIDMLYEPDAPLGRLAVGSVHHVAWRTPDDDAQKGWLKTLTGRGYDVSPVMDRRYFHSIYFREPGGVLFEIATDPPGFRADESLAEMGTHLMLPPWLEPARGQIEWIVEPLRLPGLESSIPR